MPEVDLKPEAGALWQPGRFRVKQVARETVDTVTLTVVPAPEAHPSLLAAVVPGQFFMLYHFAHGEAPISVSALAPERDWIEFTIRGNGALTRALTNLSPDDVLGLRGPFGNGWPLTEVEGRDLLLIAGGIGIAPLRAAIMAISARRNAYGRVDLVYGARTPQDILFGDDLSGLADVDVHLIVDHGGPDWQGPVGFVTAKVDDLDVSPETVALLCGPEVMMRHVLTQLLEKGLAEPRIHLSMERSMSCAIGLCGHCQWGADFVCREGPVFSATRVRERLRISEL